MPEISIWPLFVTFAAIAIGAVLKMVEALHGKKLSDDESARLRAQLDALKNSKDELQKKSEISAVTDVAAKYSRLAVMSENKDTSPSNANENKDISNLTVEEIIKAINSAPPYQKDEISQKYNGIRVSWVGYLRDVMEDPRDKEKVWVNFNVSSQAIIGYSFWLSERPENFPEIRVLKRESAVRVVGDIESANGNGLCVTLKPISMGVLKIE